MGKINIAMGRVRKVIPSIMPVAKNNLVFFRTIAFVYKYIESVNRNENIDSVKIKADSTQNGK